MPAKKTANKAAKKAVKKVAKKAIEAADPLPTPKPTEVKLGAAKGRPMLQWVGKKPLDRVTAFPAQLVETFDPSGELETAKAQAASGNLYYGDNKEVLAHLLANGYRGKVDLIYIDPPFDSAADYVRKVTLRGKSALAKIDGETLSLGEQVQYTDIWANDNYLQFMYERLILLKELLRNGGSIYLHSDPSRNSYLRVLMDEVFGAEAFVNEVVWQRLSAHNDAKRYGIIHDTLYFYCKGGDFTWNNESTPLSERYIEQFFDSVEESSGRRYSRSDLTARGLRNGETGKSWKGINPGEKGNHWKVGVTQLDTWEEEGRIHWPKMEGGMPRLKRYLDEVAEKGISPQDIWYDIKPIHNQSKEILDYPTQKPVSLLERVIKVSTNSDDLVLDCFLGSGTTAAVAQKLGRRWIGCDINKGAIQTTSKRLQGIIREQKDEKEKLAEKAKGELFEDNSETTTPAALSFRVHRVNDYDLAIQHNEAVALACEHIGVVRTKTDTYFDGTQGKRLVKIIPFNHPLSPTDLEQLKGELSARENEERDILLVSLGKELACEPWLTDWSRLRKRGDVPNKIEVIELRTDAKYGKFISHAPASAKISVKRKSGELQITIEDFTSPTIIERLESQDSRLFKAQVTDWRSMVDCVMIDPAHDGKVFQIALTDVPEKKTDLVSGTYTLPAPDGKTTVAVKIIDMLGEEVFFTQEI